MALDHVDDLVVDVTVVGRATGRNRADKLRDVGAAGVAMNEVSELPIFPRRERRPVRISDDAWIRLGPRSVRLRRRHEHGDDLLWTRVVDFKALAVDEIRARVGFNGALVAADQQRAAPGGDVQDALHAGQRLRLRTARREADDALLEAVGATRRVDGDTNLRRVAVAAVGGGVPFF